MIYSMEEKQKKIVRRNRNSIQVSDAAAEAIERWMAEYHGIIKKVDMIESGSSELC